MVFAQIREDVVESSTVNNVGTAKSEAITLNFAIGQTAIGTRTEKNIELQSGYLLIKTDTIAPMGDKTELSAVRIKNISPNPFNTICTIQFGIIQDSEIYLDISDISGRIVKKLINGEKLQSGNYTLKFDGEDLTTGTYFVRLKAGEQSITERVILVK